MSQVRFLFGVHNHQPVGNFEYVLENTYNYSYKPFIDLLYLYPQVKFSLHCSGILWDYFIEKHPDFIDKIKEMVERGQIEIVSGGYYEPILSAIPQKDRINQIKMMNSFIYEMFGVKPQGLWLTERIWEQSIVKDIVDTGIKYTLVDDYHFYSAGLPKKELDGYYVTEEEGRVLYIFPISQTLRYYIPFKLVEEVIEFFKRFSVVHTSEIKGITMFDDGEKFGGWPKTYEHVYKDGWLKNFLVKILENNNWLSTSTYSEFLQLQKPKGRIYLPTASYFEMGEWTLPQESQEMFEDLLKEIESHPHKEKFLQFMRGGYWKNFLSKYPESNNMHKKMLFVSEKINNFRKNGKKQLKETIKNLYKSQCNCAYWHGVFGGLYLPHLREAIYEHLIKAEKFLFQENTLEKMDFDKDGIEEIVAETKNSEFVIKPSYGGSLIEYDLKNFDKNLLNVLSRKKEAYHRKLLEFDRRNGAVDLSEVKTIHDLVLSKEPNLSKYLYYDWHARYSFLDHFLHSDTKFENFVKCQYGEVGDFTIEPYTIEEVDKENMTVVLYRNGNVWVGDKRLPIKVVKEYVFGDSIACNYSIINESNQKVELWFLTQVNLMIPPPPQKMFGENFLDKWISEDKNKGYKIEISTSEKTNFWSFPIETISLSESGFERTYQGSCVAINYKFSLKEREKFSFKLKLEVNEI